MTYEGHSMNLLKNLSLTAVVTAVTIINVAAASTIPEWLLNPVLKDGFAAVDCVKFSGNWSGDSKLSSANARIALSQQINVSVEAIDETYDTRFDNGSDVIVTTKFSSTSKQYTKQVLSGSRIVKTDVVNISGKEYYCALATLDPTETARVFKLIITHSDRNIEPELEQALFEQFKTDSGQEQNTLQKLQNKS